ncbi:MAG: hypothetical protein DRP64_06070 [Verrucomicrobia bacterium]|nr:MAG: hypothetical protein DRP64_06070 [Verrucomicrobiota bacterium]
MGGAIIVVICIIGSIIWGIRAGKKRREEMGELAATLGLQFSGERDYQIADRIQAARRFYNGNVRDYKNKCEVFPSNLIASLFGFKPRDFFNVDPAVREAPEVKLET